MNVQTTLQSSFGEQVRGGRRYMSGFGNSFETEACRARCRSAATRRSGCLRPLCRAALRLALHRAAFQNERSWLYRVRPSVKHGGASGRWSIRG
jgi:homogentisate 1,2-dioxygenase